MSILDLVKQLRDAKARDIKLNKGHYPYPDYEPPAFLGRSFKTKTVQTRLKFLIS